MKKVQLLKIFILLMISAWQIPPCLAGTRDSLLKVLQNNPADDSAKVRLLITIAKTFYEKESDSMIMYVSKAEKLAKKLNFKSGLATSYNILGIYYYRTFKYREAYENYNKAIPLLIELKDTARLCKVYGNLRLIFEEFKDFSKQLEYSLKIDGLANKSKNIDLLIDAYLNLAFTYHSQEKHQTALKYLANALNLSEKTSKEGVRFDVMNYYGTVLKELKQYKEALPYLINALNYYESKDILYYDQASCNNNIGLIYCALENKDLAIKYLNKSQLLANKLDARTIIASNFLGFSKIDSLNRDFISAYKNFYTHVTLKNKLDLEQRLKQLTDQKIWFETEKDDIEKEKLKKEEQRQEILIQRQYLIITFLIIVLGLVLLIVVMNLRQHRKTQAMNILLEKQKMLILEKNKDMEYLHKVKDKLFSVISHDLRSPIIGIQNMLTILNNYQLSPDKLKSVIENVQEDVTETSDLLNNLLQWSRVQMKGTIPEKMTIAVLPFLSEIIRQSESIAQTKKILLDNRFALNITILCDPEMLKIVFRNLLTNAIKFSFPDNSVVIDGYTENGFIVFSVKDSGTGILPEHQSKIFSLTENVGEKGTMLEASTGLGLILCHDFIEKSGGKIWFETEQDKGSTFFFSLPLEKK